MNSLSTRFYGIIVGLKVTVTTYVPNDATPNHFILDGHSFTSDCRLVCSHISYVK